MVGKFMRGYVLIKISGTKKERLLNLAINKKVHIWDLRKKDESSMEFKVSQKGYDIINNIAQNLNVDIEIKEKFGIGEVRKKLKNRWVFAVCFFAVIFVICFSSSFIWIVDVKDYDFIKKEEVINYLSELGLKRGSLRQNIDYKYISNSLITNFDELIWADVELSGTRLKVTLVPRVQKPPIVPENIPSDIVAKRDGCIMNIIAENGEKKVKIGDTVIEGQMLITGVIPNQNFDSRMVNAQGSVMAKTWYEKSCEKKLYNYKKVPTGKVIKKREIQIPFAKIPLYLNKNIDFLNYECIIKDVNILFVTYKEYSYNEYVLKKYDISTECAIKEAQTELLSQIKKETKNIKSQKVTTTPIDEETIFVRVFVQSEEEIGQEVTMKTEEH